MNTIFSAISKNNIPIRLTYERWIHIVESHDYMAGNQELVIETIEEPDYIIKGSFGELIAARYYEKTSISKKFVIVVYKEVNNNGFVITSFMSSKIEKIKKRGEIIWSK